MPMTEASRRGFEAARSLAGMSARFNELRLFTTMAAPDACIPLATVSSLIEDGKTREGAPGFGMSTNAQLLGGRSGSLQMVCEASDMLAGTGGARDLSGARLRMTVPGWFAASDDVGLSG